MNTGTWPLVGRVTELTQVAGAMGGEAGGVLFAGPAGVGKTRLAVECLGLASQRGYRTAHVRANRSSATIPYGAFAALLPPATSRESESRGDLLRYFAEAILDDPDGRRLLLVVDDAHDLDDASAALLLHLVLHGSVFPVVTLRTAEPAPESVVMLWKDELLHRIEVSPLTVADIAMLAADVLGGPVDGTTVHALRTASEGNVLFLRELILSAVASGSLTDVRGMWRLQGSLSASPRLTELVRMRLGTLDEAERHALEVVSVGEPVAFPTVDALADRACIEGLEARALVDIETDGSGGQVRMAHPLYGEVLRAELPSGRYGRICRLLADAVEGSGELSADDALRVGVWRLESGDTEHAQLLMTAAHQAAFAFDFPLARRLAAAAWEAGAGIEAGHVLGNMLDTLGEHEAAEDVLRTVEAEARTDEERVQISEARVGNLFRGLGRTEQAEEVTLAAERAVRDPELRAELTAQRAVHAVFAADMGEALALSEPLLDETRHPGRVVVKAALAAGTALALAGRTADAIRVADRAFELRMELGNQVQMAGPGVYLVARALALTEAGRLEEAEATAEAGYHGAVESQVLEGQGWFTVMLGRTCLLQGRVETAARWLREAAVLWGELAHPSARWAFGGLAHALALGGDLDAAEAALEDLDAEPPTPIRMMDVDIERGRAWYTWLRGEHGRALGMLHAAADAGVTNGQYALAAGAFHDLVRLGEPAEAVEHLERVAEHVDGQLMPARLTHATALSKSDPPGLDDASEAFEAIGGWLYAAEAATQASTLYGREGLRRRASASAQRARTLAERCEGAKSPALETGPQPVALTKREREVATLAARGLTSREIAETIVVSTRTVENHLQRAYEKLGVSGRSELAAALGDDDSVSSRRPEPS
ncbi:MAG TPA: LuxR C-terminal-related transcriptional regulator [Acidimicrobiia bacterium]|nr:LuxR C-terminal-related transcriptional regulator [Acidimicrobiia bacterium]